MNVVMLIFFRVAFKDVVFFAVNLSYYVRC